MMVKIIVAIKGGPGSGFHGHAGRPGKRGGSASTLSRIDTSDIGDTSNIGDTCSDMRTGPMGIVYYITKSDKLIDSIDREGEGSHIGTVACAKHGKLLGLSDKYIRIAKAILEYEDTGEEEVTFNEEGDDDPLGAALEAGNIRVHSMKNSTSIQTEQISDSMLHRLQDLFYSKKLLLKDMASNFWEDLYEDNFIEFTLDSFLVADHTHQLGTGKSPIIVSMKGGPGSGFHGHAGRQGKRGGSATIGISKVSKPTKLKRAVGSYDYPQAQTSVGPVEVDFAPLIQTFADKGIKTTDSCTGHFEGLEETDGPYVQFVDGKNANIVKRVVDKIKLKFRWLFGQKMERDPNTYSDSDTDIRMYPDWNISNDLDSIANYIMDHGQINVLKNLRSDIDTIMHRFGGNYTVDRIPTDPDLLE